jgi:hypothetical protein
MEVIKAAVTEILAEHGVSPADLTGAGACCPTPVDLEGMCVYPTNIDDSWLGVNVKTDTLGHPGRPGGSPE